jgi:hypothetical protein
MLEIFTIKKLERNPRIKPKIKNTDRVGDFFFSGMSG